MPAFEISIMSLKSHEQTFKFIDPSKGAFNTDPMGVTVFIEKTLGPRLGVLRHLHQLRSRCVLRRFSLIFGRMPRLKQNLRTARESKPASMLKTLF